MIDIKTDCGCVQFKCYNNSSLYAGQKTRTEWNFEHKNYFLNLMQLKDLFDQGLLLCYYYKLLSLVCIRNKIVLYFSNQV